MAENHRSSYVALVAALRAEFSGTALEALKIQLASHRYDIGSLGALTQAVHDAQDITYDAGERAAQNCTHSADCPIHPDTKALHNFDVRLTTH